MLYRKTGAGKYRSFENKVVDCNKINEELMQILYYTVLFLCVSCSGYKTPQLPSFDQDKIKYDQVINEQKLLQDKLKSNQEQNEE